MQFDYSEEQRLLSDSVARFINDQYDFHTREKGMKQPDGFSREVWAGLAELGVLGLPFAEEDGGFGCGPVETMIVMEQLGTGLLVEPFVGTVVLAGGVLRQAGTAEQKAPRVEAIAGGELIMALAHQERGGPRHTVTNLKTSAVREGDGWRITGAKTTVIGGAAAGELIVSANTGNGTGLFLVATDAAGLTVTQRRSYDGHPLADVTLDGVVVGSDALIGPADGGAEILERVFEEATAALCAEAVGVMNDILSSTAEYLRTRTQFGVAIGSFQALQHKAVDMLIQVELARSMAVLATTSLALPVEERRLNIAAAKAKIGRAGRFIGQMAVQLHGAIGLTDELKVGHGFKRLTAIDALFGDSDHHLDVMAEAGSLPAIGRSDI